MYKFTHLVVYSRIFSQLYVLIQCSEEIISKFANENIQKLFWKWLSVGEVLTVVYRDEFYKTTSFSRPVTRRLITICQTLRDWSCHDLNIKYSIQCTFYRYQKYRFPTRWENFRNIECDLKKETSGSIFPFFLSVGHWPRPGFTNTGHLQYARRHASDFLSVLNRHLFFGGGVVQIKKWRLPLSL